MKLKFWRVYSGVQNLPNDACVTEGFKVGAFMAI